MVCCGLAASGFLPLAAQNTAGAILEIPPDGALQQQLQRTAVTIVDLMRGRGSAAAVEGALGDLRQLRPDNPEAILLQAALFKSQKKPSENIEDERQLMAASVIIGQLMPDARPKALLGTLSPYLYQSGQPANRQLRKLMDLLTAPRGEHNFSDVAEFLSDANPAAPPGPIAYLLLSAPRPALALLAELYLPDDANAIAAAAGRIADDIERRFYQSVARRAAPDPAAMDQLADWATAGEWWLRLYVAVIVAEHPEYAGPGVVAQLENDASAWVRRAVSGGLR